MVLAGVGLAIVLAWVSTSGEVHLWHESTDAAVSNQAASRSGATATTILTDATVTSLPAVDAPPAAA